MVLVPGGTYRIGDDIPDPASDAPLRDVSLDPFYIDRHEVTNRQYREFVAATGYRTTAERGGGGWVYRSGASDWERVSGANWRQPLGPGSSIDDALDQLPDLPDTVGLVVRGDSALATHDVVDHLVEREVGFSVSYPLSDAVKDAIRAVIDNDGMWEPAIRQDGTVRA
ncbi:MAG: SUMF1/EgtB/PvdO family nonheme iron enzyme, partial [Acidobacteria bacterium]|nr:SUMF1/EgtB/PvdO family nonheme iron enzyme [Acidobacteriota bacterium]